MINNDLDPIEDLEMLKTAKNEWKICSVERPRKYQLKVEQSMCNLKQLYDEYCIGKLAKKYYMSN